MKLTKTILAAVALATVAAPMAAQAQSSVIGNLDSVTGQNVTILRAGQLLRAQNASAILAGDVIEAGAGSSAMVRLNGCNGKFSPCDQLVSAGNMVNVGSNNYCGNLAALLPGNAGSVAGNTIGGTLPTAGPSGSIFGGAGSGALRTLALAALGGGAAYGLYEILDDDDDDDIDLPVSP